MEAEFASDNEDEHNELPCFKCIRTGLENYKKDGAVFPYVLCLRAKPGASRCGQCASRNKRCQTVSRYRVVVNVHC